MGIQRYNARVADYFSRAPMPGGTDVTGSAGSVEQGTYVSFTANRQGARLVDVGFRAFACPHIMASCSWLAEQLEMAPAEALLEPWLEGLRVEFDIPVEKTGKLLILQDALQDCYANFVAGKTPSA